MMYYATVKFDIYRQKNKKIVYLLAFKRVGEKKECNGSEIEQGTQKTIYLCHDVCEGLASMFIYGLAPDHCNKDGCNCSCKTSSKDENCTVTDHSGFNLYAYTEVEQGEKVITINFSLFF